MRVKASQLQQERREENVHLKRSILTRMYRLPCTEKASSSPYPKLADFLSSR